MHFLAQSASSFISGLVEHFVSSTKPLNSAAIPLAASPKANAATAVHFFINTSPFTSVLQLDYIFFCGRSAVLNRTFAGIGPRRCRSETSVNRLLRERVSQ